MALEEFYTAAGGDLETVRGRLVTDERIEKFANLFFMDPTFNNLVEAYSSQDWEGAFRGAHTMKGTCRDMGFNEAADAASELCESLRLDEAGSPRNVEGSQALYSNFVEKYNRLLKAKELL